MDRLSRITAALYDIPDRIVYTVFALVMLLKGGYYGYLYNPVLDDFIQYHTYTLYGDPFADVITKMGLLSGRPLAAIFDIYFWSRFWDCMWLANLIITALFTLSGILIYRIFSRHFGVTPVFLFIYGLLPVTSEAVNWLSASSRIVVPMCFLGAALNLLQFGFDEKDMPKKAAGYALGTLLLFASMAFYEQIAIVAFILGCTLLIANKKRVVFWLVVVLPSAALACFYLLGDRASIYTGRMNIIDFSAPADELSRHLSAAFKKIFYLIFELNRDTALYDLEKGVNIIINDKSVLFAVLVLLAAVAVFFVTFFHAAKEKRTGGDKRRNYWVVLLAFILIFLPIFMFAFLQNPWISMRNVFPSVLGMALLSDLVFKWLLYDKYVRAAAISALCVCFLIANTAELGDYLLVGRIDRTIAENTWETLSRDAESESIDTVVVLNTRSAYVDTAVKYNEHINNITSSDWAYKGALYAVSDSLDAPDIYPLHEGPILKMYPDFDVDEVDAYYYMDDDFRLHRLEAVAYNENFSLYDGDVLYAEVLRWNYQDPSISLINEDEAPRTFSYYSGFEVK